MRYALLLLLTLVGLQDQKKDLKAVNEKMAKLKSYHFSVKLIVDGADKLTLDGEYFAPEALHVRSDKTEVARNGDKKLVKGKDEEWKEPVKTRRKSEADDAAMPHEWVKKMSDECGLVKREKSDKIGNVTVDIYVGAPGGESAKKAAEGGGIPFIASIVDWTKTKNGILFSVGRDDLYYRVEQRFDSERPGGKSGSIVIEFSEFDRAKCLLPDDVKKRLGME